MSWSIEIRFDSLQWIDWLVILSTTLVFILGIAHNIFGKNAFGLGSDMKIFKKHGDWMPEGSKQRTLLGVFYMITFSWWESSIILILLILAGNPLGKWMGLITLLSSIGQLVFLLRYVKWNYVAQGVFSLHSIVCIIWLFF